MRQTSIWAYNTLDNAKISERQHQVLEALMNIEPANNRMVSEHSHIPINVVTPRMGELVKKGLVEQAYVNVDITGRRAIYWKAKVQEDNDSPDTY